MLSERLVELYVCFTVVSFEEMVKKSTIYYGLFVLNFLRLPIIVSFNSQIFSYIAIAYQVYTEHLTNSFLSKLTTLKNFSGEYMTNLNFLNQLYIHQL